MWWCVMDVEDAGGVLGGCDDGDVDFVGSEIG